MFWSHLHFYSLKLDILRGSVLPCRLLFIKRLSLWLISISPQMASPQVNLRVRWSGPLRGNKGSRGRHGIAHADAALLPDSVARTEISGWVVHQKSAEKLMIINIVIYLFILAKLHQSECGYVELPWAQFQVWGIWVSRTNRCKAVNKSIHQVEMTNQEFNKMANQAFHRGFNLIESKIRRKATSLCRIHPSIHLSWLFHRSQLLSHLTAG